MRRTGMVAGIAVVALLLFPAPSAAQNCTTGGSQSTFRVMQRNQMENLPRSAVTGTTQGSFLLAEKVDNTDVYGRQLMSDRELKRYLKKRDKLADNPEKEAEFLEQHREKMLSRARKKGIDPATLESKPQPAAP